ncbi:type II toxin-antitoxin system VapC family toxin [Nocardioides sp. Root151]|uniref:type II toxin-antitoxin system VapC family toxin n=1 Tax=Nocardioides sp. Root151 TaxID=1736475 RepID=UPI0007033E4A|nr:TA system VapC family ribonuclease toxin [Nocardioides sp. Root151]KQZ67273.1 toxin PIN [Nocardioides sp. Root151]
MIAVDTNVLVYAHREDSPHHAPAAAALHGLATGRAAWAIPWPCVHEFLAVVTHPRIYRPATAPDVALAAVRQLVDLPNLHMISESRDHATILADLLDNTSVVGPKVHDARIAAICLGHGVETLLSADRDFSWFPALNVANPLVT